MSPETKLQITADALNYAHVFAAEDNESRTACGLIVDSGLDVGHTTPAVSACPHCAAATRPGKKTAARRTAKKTAKKTATKTATKTAKRKAARKAAKRKR